MFAVTPKNSFKGFKFLMIKITKPLLQKAIIAGFFSTLTIGVLTLLTYKSTLGYFLAGSFGSYLSPASAIGIGLVPKLPVMRIVSAGNVAGEGAKMVLLSSTERSGATTLLDEVDYVELSDRPDFNDKFFLELALPS